MTANLEKIPEASSLSASGGEIIVSEQFAAHAIAVDEVGGRVYWTTSRTEGAVYSADLAGCDQRQVAGRYFNPGALALLDAGLAWIGNEQATVSDREGGMLRSLGPANSLAGLAVASNKAYVMVTSCSLEVIDLGSGARSVASEARAGLPAFVRSDGQSVVFACAAPDRIFAFDPGSGETRLVQDLARVQTALAVQGGEVYWAEADCADLRAACYPFPSPGCCPGRVLRRGLSSTSSVVIASDDDGPPLGLAVGPDGSIFWGTYGRVSYLRRGEGNVERLSSLGQSFVSQFSFGAGDVFWTNPRRASDVISEPGYIVRFKLVPPR